MKPLNLELSNTDFEELTMVAQTEGITEKQLAKNIIKSYISDIVVNIINDKLQVEIDKLDLSGKIDLTTSLKPTESEK